MKNELIGIKSRLSDTEKSISDVKNRIMENESEERKEEQLKKKQNSLRDFGANIKCTNICIVEVPEWEQRDKGVEISLMKSCLKTY